MKLESLKCVNENVSLKDYYELYHYVRRNMEHPEWLGLIEEDETKKILNNNGKIWLYYYNNIPVCSVFYIPSTNELLKKHNVNTDENETGTLGPIMVRKEYVGKNLMNQMLKIFNDYNKNINNKYIFTKAAKDNIYSVRNILNDGYNITDEYENERGLNLAFIKII